MPKGMQQGRDIFSHYLQELIFPQQTLATKCLQASDL